jgi:hypothetical protein
MTIIKIQSEYLLIMKREKKTIMWWSWEVGALKIQSF